MAITFPAPGLIAAKINTITNERMKKTDARVQQVTESASAELPSSRVIQAKYLASDEHPAYDQAVRLGEQD